MERAPTAAFKGLSGQIRVYEEDPWLWITLVPHMQVQCGSKEKTLDLSFNLNGDSGVQSQPSSVSPPQSSTS